MSGAAEIDAILARLDSREERFAEGVERRTARRAKRSRPGTDPGGDGLADRAVAPRTRRYTPADLAADAAAYAPFRWRTGILRLDQVCLRAGPDLTDFAQENKEWLRIYRLPAYAPDLNPRRS